MIFNIRYIDLIIVYINTLGFFKNALTLLIAFKYTNKFIIFAKFTYPGIPRIDNVYIAIPIYCD